MTDAAGPQGPEMASLESLVGYNLRRGYGRFAADLREALAPHGLSQRTFSVLSVVVANPGITQSEVARGLGIERSGTVVTVDELEAKRLVTRMAVPGDRRAHALNPTAEGRAVLKRARGAVAAHEDKLLGGFSTAERETFLSLLHRLY